MVAPFFEPVTETFCQSRRPYLRLLWQAAQSLGGRLEAEPTFAHILRYWPPQGPAQLIFGAALEINSAAASRIAEDKDYTARLLADSGLPTPKGVLITAPRFKEMLHLRDAAAASRLPGIAAAQSFAAAQTGAMYLKPNTGSEGLGVERLNHAQDLLPALERGLAQHTHLRLETAVPGEDARLLVLHGQVRAAYRRMPPSVTGDGTSTVAQLLAAMRKQIAANRRGAKIADTDPRIDAELQRQGLNRASVPKANTTIRLLAQANHATGGTVEDLTGRLPPETEALALSAAQTLGLTLAGVDIVAPDLTGSAKGATVLEVNSAPGLSGYANAGPTEWARARTILQDALKG